MGQVLKRGAGWVLVLTFVGLSAIALLTPEVPQGVVMASPTADGSSVSLQVTSEPSVLVAGSDFSSKPILTEAEIPYGPLLKGWDTEKFVQGKGGALATYTENSGGENLTGAQIVERVALSHSLSPKVLLALVDGASNLADPFQTRKPGSTLRASLDVAAAWVDDGFYGAKYRGETLLYFADQTSRPGLEKGIGHFAVSRFLALSSTPEELPARQAEFAEAYRRLFGPRKVSVATDQTPPSQPQLSLPFPAGERWKYTGGPHGAWGVATAWGAVDFASTNAVGCGVDPAWVVAAASGVVVRSERGLLMQDLDNDGDERTGWVLMYLHLATGSRPAVGTQLSLGEPVGHPSCEGGHAEGAHVHFARKYNGEWMPAGGGPAPLVLSGWEFTSAGREYDGAVRRNGEIRYAQASGPDRNSILTAESAPQLAQSSSAVVRPVEPVPTEVPTGELMVYLDQLPPRPFSMVVRDKKDNVTLIVGHTGEASRLPHIPEGRYTLEVNVPGFKGLTLYEVPLGAGRTEIRLDDLMVPAS